MADDPADTRPVPITRCALGLSDAPWDFALRHTDAIAEHWARARIERPKLFNGIVHLLRDWRLSDGTLAGTFLRTDFKSFLYWRETGYAETGVRDAFGSSLIRSADGAILLGRQTEGHMNSGFVYPLSGMIDVRDAKAGGIDIDTNVARELHEESGLAPADFERVPGYLVTVCGALVSIAIEWRSALEAEPLRRLILEHVARQSEPELADIVIVRGRADIDRFPVPAYACALLSRILRA